MTNQPRPYALIYDLFDGQNYGLYESESVTRIAGIVERTDRDGFPYYEGFAYNIPRLESRQQESLDEFADRLYFLFTTKRADKLRAQDQPSFDLFS